MVEQRSQDFLVDQDNFNGNQNTRQSINLTTPRMSGTGGQTYVPQRQEVDKSRQQFRTRNRQIRENRPVDFTVQQVEPAYQRIQSDLRAKAEEQIRDLAETAPKVEEFLPDYQKALTGDQEAIMRTGQRLQQEQFVPREVKPIYSTEGAALQDFLKQSGPEAYQTELSRQRGNVYGLNALDAAILGYTGAGSEAFGEARQRLGSAYDIVPELTKQIRDTEAQKAIAYQSAIEDLRNQILQDEAAMRAQAESEIEAYKNRDVTMASPEIADLFNTLSEQNPELARFIRPRVRFGYSRPIDFEPFVDRDMTFAETLDPQEYQRYNVLAELLGTAPVQQTTPEAPINMDRIVPFLLEEATKRKAASDKAKAERELYPPGASRAMKDHIRRMAELGITLEEKR